MRLPSPLSLLLLSLALGYSSAQADNAGKPTPPTSPVDYESVQLENGKFLRYRQTSTGYLLVLVPGQEILTSLQAFQSKLGFKFATVTGLGDVAKTTISHFNTTTRQMDKSLPFNESHEMSSLICSLSLVVDRSGPQPKTSPIAHCHINLGLSPAEGYRVVGGHLISATVSVVGELFITTATMNPLATKTHDHYFNGNLFDLNSLDVLAL